VNGYTRNVIQIPTSRKLSIKDIFPNSVIKTLMTTNSTLNDSERLVSYNEETFELTPLISVKKI
jgi:hypothetical protein